MNWRCVGFFTFNLIGMAAAAYLTYTHLFHLDPQCYGLGDCAFVQASSYAKMFGVPVALLGLLDYVVMLGTGAYAFVLGREYSRMWALQALVGITFASLLYSAYLTFIEAFVLHGYCIYCLISAFSITMMFLFTLLEWRARDR